MPSSALGQGGRDHDVQRVRRPLGGEAAGARSRGRGSTGAGLPSGACRRRSGRRRPRPASSSISARSSALPKFTLPPPTGAILPSTPAATFSVTWGRSADSSRRGAVIGESNPLASSAGQRRDVGADVVKVLVLGPLQEDNDPVGRRGLMSETCEGCQREVSAESGSAEIYTHVQITIDGRTRVACGNSGKRVR